MPCFSPLPSFIITKTYLDVLTRNNDLTEPKYYTKHLKKNFVVYGILQPPAKLRKWKLWLIKPSFTFLDNTPGDTWRFLTQLHMLLCLRAFLKNIHQTWMNRWTDYPLYLKQQLYNALMVSSVLMHGLWTVFT